MTTLKTLLIDDERLAREELKLLLNKHDEIDVIDEAKNGEEGISKIKGGLNVLYDMNYPKEIIKNTIEIQKLESIKNSLVK